MNVSNRNFVFAATVAVSLIGVAGDAGAQLWSSPATWGGKVPKAGDVVLVPAGKTITLDVKTPTLKGLRIDGTLVAAANKDVAITSNYVVVKGGRLQIGTPQQPFTRSAIITLTGGSTAEIPTLPGIGNKVLGLIGGSISLHGTQVAKSWTKLGANANKGARSITLAEAPGWRVGDSIVIASSSRKMGEYDVAQIASVNGRTINLKAPLKFRHLGLVQLAGGRPVDVRAEVGLMTRNIVVQGDTNSEQTKIGGHAMFMNPMTATTMSSHRIASAPASNVRVQISGAEFRRMGQLNQVGRYPVHFHQLGKTVDCYIENSSIHDNIQRGIVLHDVIGVRASGNVLFNTAGHNFVVETEQTTGNRIENNLSLVNRQASPLQNQNSFIEQNDRMPANFWLRSGNNVVTGNSAAGSFANGFSFDSIPGDAPMKFRNNVAHAAMGQEGFGAGDFDLMAGILILSGDERPVADEIVDNLVYHNSIGFWAEETGLFRVQGLIAADNDLQTENRSTSIVYRDAFLVGRLTENREFAGPALHFQYASDVNLINPTFANYDGPIAAATDIATAPQSSLWITNAQYLNLPKPWPAGGDDMVVTYLDDTVLPQGSYVYQPYFAGPGAVSVNFGLGDEGWSMWKNPRKYSYSELSVYDLSNPGQSIHQSVPLVRSDGLEYTGGLHGYSVLFDSPLTFQTANLPSAGFIIRLSPDAVFDARVANETAFLEVAVPVGGAPRSVARITINGEEVEDQGTRTAMRLATSRADFDANPLTTYLLAAGKVIIKASVRGVEILP